MDGLRDLLRQSMTGFRDGRRGVHDRGHTLGRAAQVGFG